MENIFSFKVVVRFVLPGLLLVISLALLIDFFWLATALFCERRESLVIGAFQGGFGAVNLFFVISFAFILGIILNGAEFEKSYEALRVKYVLEFARQNALEKKVFSFIYKTIDVKNVLLECISMDENESMGDINSFLNDKAKDSCYRLFRDNRRGVAVIFDDSKLIESMRDEISPYIDLQTGLSIAFYYLAIVFPFWLILQCFVSGGDLHGFLYAIFLSFIACLFLRFCVKLLRNSAYKNYIKMRQSRVVMLVALVGKLRTRFAQYPKEVSESTGV